MNIRISKLVFLFTSLVITATAQPAKRKVALQNLWTQNFLTINNDKVDLEGDCFIQSTARLFFDQVISKQAHTLVWNWVGIFESTFFHQ